MAYHWFMTVEAESEEAARKFAASFDVSPIVISDGGGYGFRHTITLEIAAEKKDNLWWSIVIFPSFALREGETHPEAVASRGGTESAEHAKILTLIGNALYDRLLRTSPFDVAVLGVECESFFGFGEHDDLVDDLRRGWTCGGLVVSAALWEQAGKPKALVSRIDGTYWIPWEGETFKDEA